MSDYNNGPVYVLDLGDYEVRFKTTVVPDLGPCLNTDQRDMLVHALLGPGNWALVGYYWSWDRETQTLTWNDEPTDYDLSMVLVEGRHWWMPVTRAAQILTGGE